MSLTRVSVTAVRNLHPVILSPSPHINIFYSDNGGSRASVFEAIHLLGLTRSFRSTRLQPAIQYKEAACTIFSQVMLADGIASNLRTSREHQDESTIHIDGQNTRSTAQLAEILPLQLIDPNSFRLFEEALKIHRQLLDQGVFHIEPRFLPVWQRLQKALRQRNPQFRHGKLDPTSQAAWNRELNLANDEIDTYRRSRIQALETVFGEALAELVSLDDLALSYYRGWGEDRDLLEILVSSLLRGQQMGHIQAGPQRADLHVRLAGHNTAEILSRGQQKLVVRVLRITQGHLINRAKNGQCVCLVNDLLSELDEQHRMALCCLLEDLGCQVFIACMDPQLLRDGWYTDTPVSMFHVGHGKVPQTTIIGSEA